MLIFKLIMIKNLPKSSKVVVIGIGAAIHFMSGNKWLATKNLDYLGFKCPFRYISESKRLFWGILSPILYLYYLYSILLFNI